MLIATISQVPDSVNYVLSASTPLEPEPKGTGRGCVQAGASSFSLALALTREQVLSTFRPKNPNTFSVHGTASMPYLQGVFASSFEIGAFNAL